ncbi:hypothetical protein SAMN02910400_00848 [Lachnospiraceae bacterium C10]|nr:hypothetical protein SAMN02910400_00848 [Lachnospiraceae bacterium C10]
MVAEDFARVKEEKKKQPVLQLLLFKKIERIVAVVGVLFVGYNLTDEGFDSYNGLISNLKLNV